MRSRKERRQLKEERTALLDRMTQMVDEANALRNEAAEKLYAVPKGYRLIYGWTEVWEYLEWLLIFVVAAGLMALFWWCIENEFAIGIAAFLVVLAMAGIVVSAIRNRPFRTEEHTTDYYVNNIHYDALSEELKRLRGGIADYDQQYSEQEEYIKKFRDLYVEVSDFGSLRLNLKANDFYAHVKMTTEWDEVNCRLKFNGDDYGKLLGLLEHFNGVSSCG